MRHTKRQQSSPSNGYCIHCGKQLENNSHFCPHCGASAEPRSPQPASNSTASLKAKYRHLTIATACILVVLVILLGCITLRQNQGEKKNPEQQSVGQSQTAPSTQSPDEATVPVDDAPGETDCDESICPPPEDFSEPSPSQVSANMLRASPEGEILFGIENPNSITTISFQSNLNGLPSHVYDVSQNRDGSVLAWVSGSELIIAADGMITAPRDCSWMFAYARAQSINFNGCLDTSNVTSMERMFLYCSCLEYLDLSSFHTENVTTMERMFERCVSLTELDVTGFDTSHVTDMNHMFFVCISLKRLDLSSFCTDSVTNMQSMFSNCSTLTKVNLSNFDTKNVTDLRWMFYKCRRLNQIVITAFDTGSTQTVGGMFEGCEQLDISKISFIDN